MKDFDGWTPLAWAAFMGHEAVIKLLLEARVDVHSVDSEGSTPLSWAVSEGNEAAMKLLQEAEQVSGQRQECVNIDRAMRCSIV
ncbi:uncharacterized protein N7473_006737 [Penicillium subrubescens]|uniref:uncharacterized protein n=1 Tax=Penicillium subrubescens TaxID=1316194 RepID=UPI0025458134|nr:uncharacterized protein N7473_006737 [Penicillium subrubescens]KAJ5890509.1 hypothetical protein N7473_006737 [Penicillium subrubescens]